MPFFSLAIKASICLVALSVAACPSLALAQNAPAKQPAPVAKQAAPAAPAASQPAPPEPKEVSLTEAQIQHVLDAQKDFDAVAEKMPKTQPDKPDPKIVAELEATAKKHGFADYADYNNVVYTVSVVLNGFDPKTKAYVGPEAMLKQQLAAVKADTKIPDKQKTAIVKEIEDALKSPPPPVADKANVDLVTRYYDKIAATLQEE